MDIISVQYLPAVPD